MVEAVDLARPSAIHIVGVAGAGMSALAKLLSQMGHSVTGSDVKPARVLGALDDVGVATWIGHRPERMAGIDLLVASSAVPGDDPELAAARRAGAPVWQRPRLLDALTRAMPAIGFAGTHGKTTSTAMAVTSMRACGLDPSFIVGGEMAALNTGAHLGSPDLFLLESDEAYGTFRHLHHRGLLVTNIEADHLDHYGNVAALEDAFAQVADRVDGPVVACADDAGVRRLAQRSSVIGYGVAPDTRWTVSGIVHGRWEVGFHLDGPDVALDVTVPRPGMHTARNAAGVIALLAELGFDPHCAAEGLRTFAGVRRRAEVRAVTNGVTIVDDYAHHPTEVEATIAAGRHAGSGRVLAVFQPHRYTRTADLAPQFGRPLATADRVFVTDVFSAGEAPIPGVTGKIVAEAVAAAGGDVAYVPRVADVIGAVAAEARGGDLVLLLGAGDISSVADKLAETLAAR